MIKDQTEKEVKETIKLGKKIREEQDKPIDLFDTEALPGIGPIGKKKLDEAGVISYFDLCIRGSMEIREITGMPMDKIKLAMNTAYEEVQKRGVIRPDTHNPLVLMKYRQDMIHIPMRCDAIDNLLRGGLELEALYEVYGENGAGKTQMCYVACVEAINMFKSHVVWIDCEDTFRPERIIEIAMSRGYVKSKEEAQDKFFPFIHYIHASNTDKTEDAINNLSPSMDAKKPKLVIVDGAIGLFRAEYMGRGELAERQHRLSRFMDHLKGVSHIFNCCVLMTNQIMHDPGMMFGDPIKPIGGNVVGHASTYRIHIKKSGANRIMRLVKSSKDPVEDVKFMLTDKGLEDFVK